MLRRDSHLAVVVLLLCASFLGMLCGIVGGAMLGNPVMLDGGVAFCLATGMLAGVVQARVDRVELERMLFAPTEPGATAPEIEIEARARHRLKWLQTATAIVAAALFAKVIYHIRVDLHPTLTATLTTAGLAILAAWLASVTAQYLSTVDATQLPEALGLSRGARVLAWVLVSVAAAAALAHGGALQAVRLLHFGDSALLMVVVLELAAMRSSPPTAPPHFPTDLVVFAVLGDRMNPLSSAMDMAQQQLGIDLRSTWALDVVRRSAWPLLVGALLVGWLSTAATVVGVDEQGLVERLGVPLAGVVLEPGLHLHWPWPVERLLLVPVRRLQTLHVGHEEEARTGPEDVLWAREHAKNEYTLLLGNGRDLVSVDATVQYRIADPHAWQYACQNPEQTLSAICYRAVMKTTVDRSLSDVLSQNLATVTAQMRTMVQADADALGLGVTVLAFNVGGMHPPVPVASDYEAVVSAKIAGTTSVITAQAYRNAVIPMAESAAVVDENEARATTAEDLAKATGEAEGFRALESAFRTDPQAFTFRSRLETLDDVLPGRSFTVLDYRIPRDGGELWLMK